MLIEAVTKPLTYRWPGGEVRLEPGKPVRLPDDRARRLIEKAAGRVRITAPVDWLAAWREVVVLTHGIPAEDPRIQSILAAIGECDNAFVQDDWTAFQQAAEGVKRACGGIVGG